jgi:hypothetical protein
LIAIAKDAEVAKLSILRQISLTMRLRRIEWIACPFVLDPSTKFPPRRCRHLRASGWIYDVAGNHTPRDIAVTDADRTTLGTGITGGERDDIRKMYGQRGRYSGWTAFFKGPMRGGVRIAARTATGTYCELSSTDKAMPAVASTSAQ